jgi:hypothetical protein
MNGNQFDNPTYSGTYEEKDKKYECNIQITPNYIRFLNEEKTHDKVITYKDLIFFAMNEENNYIMLDITKSEEDDPDIIKFFPEIEGKA